MLKRIFEENGVQITDIQVEQFNKYYELLIEWNNKFNLTSIIEYADVVIKHYVDCGIVTKYLDANTTLLDIGAGAGFPSMVIKILRPDIDIIMVDSLKKRVTFLDVVINELGLKGIKAIHKRAEDIDNNKKNSFDYVVARAVAPLVTLAEYCLPFVKKDGQFIAMKALNTQEEITQAHNAIDILGGKIDKIESIKIYDTDFTRYLIFISKIKKCDFKYPRGKNLPRIKPLI